MPVNNSGSTVLFTGEQAKQLDAFQQRIGSLREETLALQAEAKSAKAQSQATLKERDFLQGELEQLNRLLTEKQKEYAVVREELRVTEGTVELHRTGMLEKDKSHEQKRQVLDERERVLRANESDLQKREEAVSTGEQTLAEKQALVDRAHEAFKHAAESVTWSK